MGHLSSLTQDLTKQDKRKIATIVLVMTTGLPVYVAFMSLTGVIDVPMTTFFLGLTPIVVDRTFYSERYVACNGSPQRDLRRRTPRGA